MMHIGFIEDTHFHGGTQIWVAEAVRAFIKRNQDVSLLAPEGSWVVDQCRDSGAEITTYDWDEVIHEDQQNQKLWTNALRDWDVAICTVHPPRDGFHCSMFAARCIKRGGLETHLIPKTGTVVPGYLREFYLPDETINSSVIAITDFTRKYLIETYDIPSDKIALIYQGTDTERFRHTESICIESQERYPLPKDAVPILGSIGSFEQRKGHPVLFEAVEELINSSLPNVHLMMVGDGPDETMLKEKVITLGLEQNISFFPFTKKPNYVFERLDITILPSLHKEGLPNVLLESMAMGVPVVSSNIGGVPEIVINGETGFMVEPGDKSALAFAIENIWANKNNYQEMKVKTRKLIEKQFDKATQFERFISYFHSMKATD
jgi:glycosyltransferase involved in cell wall biosynthesis